MTYEIDQGLFTKEVMIESRVIPHSHPVLTVNTRYVDNDVLQLATFLHEQFHWLEELGSEAREAAKAEFRERFPSVPDRASGGASDSESTYLHLIVCDLEFQAMTQLVGEEKAREVLRGWDHYSWVYEKVLGDPVVRRVNARHGLVVSQ